MSRVTIPDEVRQLAMQAATVLREHLPTGSRVIWFGSWVLGTAVARSDIDLAIDAGRVLEPGEFARLRDDLDRLATLRGFDLVDLHVLSDARREQVLSEGLEL
jgi:predicted nucleotidyltransferase